MRSEGAAMIPIDIERLVTWAYDELAREDLMVAADGGSGAMFSILSGIPLGSGASGPQRYAAVMPPHPDALTVDRAVQALPDVAVDWPASRAALMGDLDGFYDAWVDWDGCRRRQDGRDTVLVEPLARAPADPFAGTMLQTGELVRRAAVLRRRPRGPVLRLPACFAYRAPGMPHAMVFHVEVAERSRIARLILRRSSRHYGAHEQTAVAWWPTPIEIARARAEWSAWHAGLVALRAALAGRLQRWAPTGPAVPAEPWRDGLGPQARILHAAPPVAVKTARKRGAGIWS
jgi:hypothetical protein